MLLPLALAPSMAMTEGWDMRGAVRFLDCVDLFATKSFGLSLIVPGATGNAKRQFPDFLEAMGCVGKEPGKRGKSLFRTVPGGRGRIGRRVSEDAVCGGMVGRRGDCGGRLRAIRPYFPLP